MLLVFVWWKQDYRLKLSDRMTNLQAHAKYELDYISLYATEG